MLVVFRCIDDSDKAGPLRLEHLAEHLKWVEQNMQQIRVAGPLLDEQEQVIGSLYIFEAESIALASQLLAQDPYSKAGFWRDIKQGEFKDYAGTWVGGKNWPGAS